MGKARSLIGVAGAIALLAFAAGAGAGNGWTIRFSFVPQRAYQGLPAAVSVLVKPAGVQCSLSVRYVDGSQQRGLNQVRASAGRAAWTWNLSQSAPAGPARASVACGRAGSLTRVFTVVGSTVTHSKLSVVTKGFTQRPDRYGAGSSVSYGVVLSNPSTSEDAEDVTVLVNFVDGDNHVVQSATTRVSGIAAASTFNLGGSATLSTQTPVTKLEVVVQTGSFAARSLHIPAAQNLQIVQSKLDPGWVGEVDGEVVNDDATKVLSSAQLSVVLYDASGTVVGGGTGFLLAALPPGTRAYFSANAGLSDVPLDQASVAAISIEPTYTSP
jgi:hypothetical protein